MIITSIEIQKKNKNRYSLFVDDTFKCGVHEDVIVNLGLKKGMDFDEEFLETILREELEAKAKSEVLHFISYRMRSEKEITDKLKTLEHDDQTIGKVMGFLYEHKFIDDLAFAKAFISDKCRISRHSMKKIKYAIKIKGIYDLLFDEAKKDYEEYDMINLAYLLPIKFNKLEDKHKETPYILDQKIIAFFYQKGFIIDDIKYVLKEHKRRLD